MGTKIKGRSKREFMQNELDVGLKELKMFFNRIFCWNHNSIMKILNINSYGNHLILKQIPLFIAKRFPSFSTKSIILPFRLCISQNSINVNFKSIDIPLILSSVKELWEIEIDSMPNEKQKHKNSAHRRVLFTASQPIPWSILNSMKTIPSKKMDFYFVFRAHSIHIGFQLTSCAIFSRWKYSLFFWKYSVMVTCAL